MENSTKDKIEGTAHDVKGTVKEKVGRAINDPDLEAEGSGENVAVKDQKKTGAIEEVVKK